MYRVFETATYLHRLDTTVPLMLREQVTSKLRNYVYPQLRLQPYHGPNIRKLTSYTPPTWRYRLGVWRIFFTIDDHSHVVSMLSVSQRKDSYR